MLKCATSNQLSALLDTVDGVDGEVAAEEGQSNVTEFTRCLRTDL